MKYKLLIILFFSCIVQGCATYHITTESLLEQLVNSNQEQKSTYLFAAPFVIPTEVTGNSLREIKVLDKDEKEQTIQVTNRTGIRIWKRDGSKKTFYFNTLLVKDSFIIGKLDHFVGVDIKPINLNNIEKIELQK